MHGRGAGAFSVRVVCLLLGSNNVVAPFYWPFFMPTLQFKGKSSVWNHHLAIPYHTLETQANLGYQPDLTPKTGTQITLTPADEPAPVLNNLLIEGDNLLALKALLPQFAGRVKCIYIDPPYNTGGENWVYNDNVNSPLINDWLGKVVGKDDLTRHDKWLCMMTPRLKLLRELLADDGVIFVSIDDNEIEHLLILMNEIFGEESFLGNFVWKKRSGSNDAKKFISSDHEYVICYRKTEEFILQGLAKDFSNYTNPNNDPRGSWASDNLTCNKTKDERPNLYYKIIDPKTGITYECNPNRVWAYEPLKMAQHIKDGKVIFPASGQGTPQYKRHLEEVRSALKPASTWIEKPKPNGKAPVEEMEESEVSEKLAATETLVADYNSKATKDLRKLFDNQQLFDYPKSVSLVRSLLKQATSDNDIILDSFAGSGTTGQAVMELNKEDGGNRRFILIQMPESSEREPDKNICRDITRERLHRAIDKFGYRAGFQYWQVGQALDAETLLSGQLPTFETFARYVYYLCTGENLPTNQTPNADTYLVGTAPGRAIYLVYQPDFTALTKLALNLSMAQQMQQAHPKQKIVVYAPACFLDDEHLEAWQIEFVGIPYNLFQRTA